VVIAPNVDRVAERPSAGHKRHPSDPVGHPSGFTKANRHPSDINLNRGREAPPPARVAQPVRKNATLSAAAAGTPDRSVSSAV